MGSNTTDVFIFAEDPGAANCFQGVPRALRSKGFSVTLAACGQAKKNFQIQGEDFIEFKHAAEAHSCFKNLAPKILLTGTAENPETAGLSLIDLAKASGLKSIGIVDAAMNADLRFRGQTRNPLQHAPSFIAVVDEWTKKQFLSFGASEESVVVIGHPQYDFLAKEKLRLENLGAEYFRKKLFPNVTKKIVTFLSEGSGRTALARKPKDATFTLHGTTGSLDRTEILIEEFLLGLREVECYRVVRIHPKDTLEDYQHYAEQVDAFSQKENALELVFASDLVVSGTSMLLTEAFLLGVTSLSLLARPLEKEWLAGVRAGLLPFVQTREELALMLKKGFATNRNESALGTDAFPLGAVESVCQLVSRALNC